MADPTTDFLDQFSIENLIRKATQPAESLAVPAEYAQTKPDMMGLAADNVLASMRQPGITYNGRTMPEGTPGVPYAHTNYDGKLPVVGRDISLADVGNWIKNKESTGNYAAINREQKGNTASGAYQYTDATWNGYGGYAKAALAPPAVQDRRFQEDINARFQKFHGDPFKMIAAHFMPKYANDPKTWTIPQKTGGRTKTVADYIRYVTQGTPLEAQFNEYLARQQ